MEGSFSADRRYLRAALTNQYNVILTLGAVAFAIALASWLPVMVALLAEAAWLLIGPRLEEFRRRTDARIARADNARAARALSAEYAQRVARVEADAAEIESLCAGRVDLTSEQKREVARRLPFAVQAFVGVCIAHQRLRLGASQAPINELQTEVSTLLQALSTETDLGLRASLRRALNVAERRITQYEGNQSSAHALELALTTLQKSLTMLKEGAAGLSTGPELAAELDAATAQLSRAVALEAEREVELPGPRLSALPPAMN